MRGRSRDALDRDGGALRFLQRWCPRFCVNVSRVFSRFVVGRREWPLRSSRRSRPSQYYPGRTARRAQGHAAVARRTGPFRASTVLALTCHLDGRRKWGEQHPAGGLLSGFTAARRLPESVRRTPCPNSSASASSAVRFPISQPPSSAPDTTHMQQLHRVGRVDYLAHLFRKCEERCHSLPLFPPPTRKRWILRPLNRDRKKSGA
jgi:hypothetical protein